MAAIPGDQECLLLIRDEEEVLLLAPKENAGNSRRKASALAVMSVLTFPTSKTQAPAEKKNKDKGKGKGKGKGKDRKHSPPSGGSVKRGTSPSGSKDKPPCRFYIWMQVSQR